MTRLVRAEFRKLLSTGLWCWMLLAAAAWTAGYTALAITLDCLLYTSPSPRD